jgi:hypothetical protein
MCYTTNGLELIKLTVVGIEGRLVYETLVLPEGDILDFNTRFSGISARDLKRGPTKTLREVQVWISSVLIFALLGDFSNCNFTKSFVFQKLYFNRQNMLKTCISLTNDTIV